MHELEGEDSRDRGQRVYLEHLNEEVRDLVEVYELQVEIVQCGLLNLLD